VGVHVLYIHERHERQTERDLVCIKDRERETEDREKEIEEREVLGLHKRQRE
jgi:hypothetical protein